MQKCDYGCGQPKEHTLKSGKVCCSKHTSGCPAVREKMSKQHKGKKLIFTDTHKQNIAKAMKGKGVGKKRPFHSEFMKKHNPMFYTDMTGENNPNWKGGISQNKYCSGWSSLSEEIRDYYKTCQNPHCCGKSNIMTTHHIDYDKQNCHPDNLICLCHICNAKANGNRETHELFYRRLKNEQNNCIERGL